MYDVKSTSQPDIIALLGNKNRLQIVETGFAEQFYASHRMGPASICLKISARIAERETYRMIPLKTRLFSHWSMPLKYVKSAIMTQKFFFLKNINMGIRKTQNFMLISNSLMPAFRNASNKS